MEFDLDPLDDILTGAVTKNARAGGKFQPKAKPRPRKLSSSSVPCTQSLSVVENECTETLRDENEDSFSGVHFSKDIRSSELGNPSSEHVAIPEGDGDWHSYSCIEKSAGENVDIFLGLESLDDLLCRPETVMVNAGRRSSPEVDMSAQLGNHYSAASCSVSTIAEHTLPHSEPSNGRVSDMRNAEGGLGTPVVYPVNDTAGNFDNAPAPTCTQLPAAQYSLTCRDTPVSNCDGDFHIDNTWLETEVQEADIFPGLETPGVISEMTNRSGRRTGKYQPKPKPQIPIKKHAASIPSEEPVQSVSCPVDGGSAPLLQPYDAIDLSSVGFSDSIPLDPTFELPVNEEMAHCTEISHSRDAIHGEQSDSVSELPRKAFRRAESGKTKAPTVPGHSPKHQKASTLGQEGEAGKSIRQRRKRINAFELIDEPEDEALDDVEFAAGDLAGSVINENDDDDEYQKENESQNKKVRRKSKKNVSETEKPSQKRKMDGEESDKSAKEPRKKFSHSTRRSRRRVDKVLLETPEDEIDFQKLPIRDLILLAEYKERTSVCIIPEFFVYFVFNCDMFN
ncbi:unnamed protein product [Ilex paraguariensis]|uniref:Uncharacterized protein n=1 Tax=Ilex paraguariensis TaxID=185542 RepID=A0ABC8SE13_9AQUA